MSKLLTYGNIQVTNSSRVLLPRNPNRKAVWISTNSGDFLRIAFGQPAALLTAFLAFDGLLENRIYLDDHLCPGALGEEITGISSAGGITVTILELTNP